MPSRAHWQHLPRQLRQLGLANCNLKKVPAQLAGLTQVSKLELSHNGINCGWQYVPQQLQQLDLGYCDLQQVPA